MGSRGFLLLLSLGLCARSAEGGAVYLVGRTVAVMDSNQREGRIVEFNLEAKVPSLFQGGALLKQDIWPEDSASTGLVFAEVLMAPKPMDPDTLRAYWLRSSFPDTLNCPRAPCYEVQLDITNLLHRTMLWGNGVIEVLLRGEKGVSLGRHRLSTRLWVGWEGTFMIHD